MEQEYLLSCSTKPRKRSISIEKHHCRLNYYSVNNNLITSVAIAWETACRLLYSASQDKEWLRCKTFKQFKQMSKPKEILWLVIT